MGRKKDEKAYLARLDELLLVEVSFHAIAWEMAKRMGYISEGQTGLMVENFKSFGETFFAEYDAKAKELEEVRA